MVSVLEPLVPYVATKLPLPASRPPPVSNSTTPPMSAPKAGPTSAWSWARVSTLAAPAPPVALLNVALWSTSLADAGS